MAKVDPFVAEKGGPIIGYHMDCPGCGFMHAVQVVPHKGRPVWTFNGDMDKPTFSPSILVTWEHGENYEKRRCHSFIRDGKWQFLNDCTHDLAGQTVPMEDVDDAT